jgi:hypothetical protein
MEGFVIARSLTSKNYVSRDIGDMDIGDVRVEILSKRRPTIELRNGSTSERSRRQTCAL